MRTSAILFTIACACLCLVPAAGAVELYLAPSSAEPSGTIISDPAIHNANVDQIVTYTFLLTDADEGLAGYNITISLDNPAIGEIVGVEFPAWAGMNDHSPLPGKWVWCRAVDLAGTSGTDTITLISVQIEALQNGFTDISMNAFPPGGSIEDRAGGRYNPTIKKGVLYVGPPVAAFTASPTTGTAPLTIQFTDQSSNNPTAWKWEYSTGGAWTLFSTSQHPSHLFTSAGVYSIRLTATNAGVSVTKTKMDYITVTDEPTPAPTAAFTASPTTGTAPLTVQFTDQSTNNPTSWRWEYSTGGAWTQFSTSQNPSHLFTSVGAYSIRLTATNAHGSDTKQQMDYITVTDVPTPAPTAAFTASPTTGTAPLTVDFTDQSTNNPTAWKWEYSTGDAWTQFSTSQNPSHLFTSAGTYSIRLTATNAGGSDTRTKMDYITVFAEPSETIISDPAIHYTNVNQIVTYTFRLTEADKGLAGYEINISLDNPAIGEIVEVEFPAWAGIKDHSPLPGKWVWCQAVDLTGTSGTGTITLISVQIKALQNGFTDISMNAFPPGGSIEDRAGGRYNPTIKKGVLNVGPPVAAFTASPTTGIAPLTVDFTDQSTNNPTSWKWEYSTGGAWTQFSTSKNPSYQFTSTGTYSIRLTATNPCGSDTRTKIHYITVTDEPIPAPTAAFTASPTAGTAPLTVDFTDQSTNNPTAWKWEYSTGGTWTQFSTSKNPSYQFTSTGTYSIRLTATNAGGSNTVTRTGYITVTTPPSDPVAAFNATPTSGPDPLTVSFSDDSIGLPAGWAWYFGDDRFNGPWQKISPDETKRWSKRSGHTTVALPDGAIILMGGHDGTFRNDVWESTDNGVTWSLIADNPGWTARRDHAAVVLMDGSILLIGGRDVTGRRNDVWRSTDGGITWAEMTDSAGWSPRSDHAAVTAPGKVIVIGGHADDGYRNDVWISTDRGETWSRMTQYSGWTPRFGHIAVTLQDNSIILCGGYDGSFRNDVWRSIDNGQTWVIQTDAAGWTGREGHTGVALSDGSVILIGGDDSSHRNDVWRSTNNGKTWSTIRPIAQVRSAHSTSVLPDDSIVVLGGENAGYISDVWRLPYIGAEWEEMTRVPGWYGVNGRYGHASATLPDGVIILMGGQDGTGWKNDVWRSGNSGGTWELVTPAGAWSPREGHSAVVLSDGRIILMGGRDATGRWMNDVWQSDNGGLTWAEVTPAAGWSWRHGHSAVALHDDSIFVMGGIGNNYIRMNDVWSSDDGGKNWERRVESAPWTPRYGHSAVSLPELHPAMPACCGDIVLMGGDDGSLRNDVWRSTDNGKSWDLVTGSAGWSPRSELEAFAFPDQSIVVVGGSYFNDVWRSTDFGATWIREASSAPWAERNKHTTVMLPDGSLVLFGGVLIDGDDTSSVWQLKTAASSLQHPVHTYAGLGTYSVTLQVYNEYGFSSRKKTGYINVMPPPIVAFTAAPTTGTAPLTVQFTDTSTGDPTAWSWEYSTGSPGWTQFSTEQHPEQEFTEARTYSIRLTVTNAAGSDTETKENYISVTDAPPPVGWTGVFGKGHWFVNDGEQGIADAWHFGAAGDEPFVLEDGRPGVFGKGYWFVRDPTTGGIADAWHFGASGDIPFVLADGRTGVFGNGHWFVRDPATGGIADAWHFGAAGDRPFVLADGRTGVFGNGHWFVRDPSGGIADAWHFGDTGDIPFVLADGRTGVFGNGHWFVRDPATGGIADAWHFGSEGDRPVIGI